MERLQVRALPARLIHASGGSSIGRALVTNCLCDLYGLNIIGLQDAGVLALPGPHPFFTPLGPSFISGGNRMVKNRTPEQDLRAGHPQHALTTPHRQLAQVWPVHADLVQKDPLFYMHLAAWYHDPRRRARSQGDVHHHLDPERVRPAPRRRPGPVAGQLPPYQVVRVIDFINGKKKRVAVRGGAKKGATGAQAETVAATAEPAASTTALVDVGLFRNPPAVAPDRGHALPARARRADADWFDSSVLVARKHLEGGWYAFAAHQAGRAGAEGPVREGPAGRFAFVCSEDAGERRQRRRAGRRDPHATPCRTAWP